MAGSTLFPTLLGSLRRRLRHLARLPANSSRKRSMSHAAHDVKSQSTTPVHRRHSIADLPSGSPEAEPIRTHALTDPAPPSRFPGFSSLDSACPSPTWPPATSETA